MDGLPAAARVVAKASRAMRARARAAVPMHAIVHTVEGVVSERGISVCRELSGHGIGREIHEWPDVPSFEAPGLTHPLTAGLVITIEPIIAAGDGEVFEADDGWT